MEFHCRLVTSTGETSEGVYDADDETQLRRAMEDKGFLVLSLTKRRVGSLPSFSLPRRRRVRPYEFTVFNQELATLLAAGMPLVQSLDILRQRVENDTFSSVLDDVCEQVRGGTSLSDAFESHGDLFPRVYTACLMAGEKSGSLEEILRRYVSYARMMASVRQKTISAMVYPIILLALSVVVVAIIVLRVVPQFADFYSGLGATLPWITRVIMTVSGTLSQYFFLILAGTLAAVSLGWSWLRRPGHGALVDRFLLRVPGVGGLARKFAASQLSRTLATLIKGGIPLVSALDVAARAIGNRYFCEQLSTVSRDVREGRALSESLETRDMFPPVAIKMIEVGESTGALQDMLNSISDFFDEEIETSLTRFMAMVEPLLLVIMGLIIAVLLLALYMPLIQLGSYVT